MNKVILLPMSARIALIDASTIDSEHPVRGSSELRNSHLDKTIKGLKALYPNAFIKEKQNAEQTV